MVKDIELEQAAQMEEFIFELEQRAIKMAERKGVRIKIEKDNRGRYNTLQVRAVEPQFEDKPIIVSRLWNGVNVSRMNKYYKEMKTREGQLSERRKSRHS